MGRWSSHWKPAPQPKARRDYQAVAAARSARRTALLREALRVRESRPAADGQPLTYEWLTEQTGVPLGYLRWRFPVLDDLRSELGEVC